MTTPGAAAQYIMIGGFLGAGKSTAVIRLADYLRQRGRRVGLITNDQSIGLVDTALMKSHGFAVQEIPGGCFCCRFDSLIEASEALAAQDAPDVFIAEPVGSCTDLVATVSYPLRRMYGERYTIAPLSVIVDPVRAERVLGLEADRRFSDKVIYVYQKQLEEASIIAINKVDLLDGARRTRLREALQRAYPHAEVVEASARHGDGLDAWFERITTGAADLRDTMAIDYDTYAEGEALLGWLNTSLALGAEAPFDGEAVMMDIALAIRNDLTRTGEAAEIAHLKMTLLPDGHDGRIATLNCVNNDFVPELTESLAEQMRTGELVINLRAEAAPQRLEGAVREAITAALAQRVGVRAEFKHLERFRPGRPEPKWRMLNAETLTPFAP